MSNGSDIKAPKGKPGGGPAKTTVKKVIPVEIKPTKAEFVVVLDKTGAVPAAYPILNFDVKGPPGWFFEVQVARKDATAFTEGPGLTGAWDKAKAPKDRLPQAAYSSWSNGEKALKLNGAGKAKYTLPLDWWKDQARQPRKTFVEDDFYRALAFKDASGSSPRFSTPNGGAAPSVKAHNNLADFKLTDVGYTADGLRKPERIELTVLEPDTTEMYTVVQWKSGKNPVWGGTDTYSTVVDYGKQHYINADEWSVDSLTENPRPSFMGGAAGPTISADKKTASGTDSPGGAKSASDKVDFNYRDFESRVHLNFEVPDKVTISKLEGSAPVYDKVIGIVSPEPFILDLGKWKFRILQETQPDGSIKVTQPDTYAGPPPPPPKGGCFIATAAHGSDMAPEVQFLRQIRDGVLRPTRWGLAFFDNYWKHYYRISPAIAAEMERDPELRRIVRWSILDPWTFYLKLAVTRPDWDRVSLDSLDPVLRKFLIELRKDMDRWLSAIELPVSFADLDPVDAVRELNIALDLVRRTGGLGYLDQLLEAGELPLRYAPESETTLLELLRGAGRSNDQINRILYGNSGRGQP